MEHKSALIYILCVRLPIIIEFELIDRQNSQYLCANQRIISV